MQRTRSVEKVTPGLVNTANEMIACMTAHNGLGLAANQVGLDISLIILRLDGGPIAMFNPSLVQKSPTQEYNNEGCLSFEGMTRCIKRPTWVKIKYRDINNKMQYTKLDGLMARAFIHELEHLHGILFISHLEKDLT